MFQSPDYSSTLSMKLSEVMEDVGLNEEMVLRMRRGSILNETINTLTGYNYFKIYILGSITEGTTTLELDSDLDRIFVDQRVNVMQDWSEWKRNKFNHLMIQDENVTPGYCLLQKVRSDVPLPVTHIPDDNHVRDSSGRILLKNTIFTGIREGAERQGPSIVIQGDEHHSDMDYVIAFPFNSWPQLASNFIERQGIVRWPTSEMINYAAGNGCFVVGASSKISTFPELEWRISTSLAERYLMFNLNITQMQCYVLMKIVLKIFLNPRKENGMSSYMCKTVLLHCIENTDQNVWAKNNLYTCLTYCLLELHSCVQNDNCPHFMIPENNLMTGQFNLEENRKLLKTISDIIQSDGRYLLRINLDCISQRLQVKLNKFPYNVFEIPSPIEIREQKLHKICMNLAESKGYSLLNYFLNFEYFNIRKLVKMTYNLTKYIGSGNRFEHIASRVVVKFLYSTLGSALASFCPRQNSSVLSEALIWLFLGLNSDVTSGRLKLASVFFCKGDFVRTEYILKQTERQYDYDNVVPFCGCCPRPAPRISSGFKRKCSEQNEVYIITYLTSYCVIFLPIETNCVPRELRYEMKRSTQDDMHHRNTREKLWMNFAAIDSLPFLYFLQYKTYGYLQRYQDKQHALNNLIMSIETVHVFGHRETALNLLGQCMEEENKPRKALQCYILSLRQRARNNAAKIHICCLLAKLVRNM